MNLLLKAAASYLADGGESPSDVNSTTGHGPEWGEAAPIGLLVIVLLCIALYFLVKSMNRNLKKVPETFDPQVPVSVGSGSDAEHGSAQPGSTRALSGDRSDDVDADPPGSQPLGSSS